MKGIEKVDKEASRTMNYNKPEKTVSGVKEVETTNHNKVTNHSTRKIGSFFDTLITRAKDWMSDDIE
jgi:hypothetical protein